jgi:hypothetical protein
MADAMEGTARQEREGRLRALQSSMERAVNQHTNQSPWIDLSKKLKNIEKSSKNSLHRRSFGNDK